ncbi:hypothetical protein L873DRAFT_1809459 [Choiromyces venosus 120613-1]|uniref:Uncharacterized protein n=1 Tax=Choiromyces venosus 120613-1 TaxID=1336337 RepID=A0A3N4JHD0_9PEZI|nr:hypothetical protein L873DRAFT_1809459 [Choiromyces venosus 120613-1]
MSSTWDCERDADSTDKIHHADVAAIILGTIAATAAVITLFGRWKRKDNRLGLCRRCERCGECVNMSGYADGLPKPPERAHIKEIEIEIV